MTAEHQLSYEGLTVHWPEVRIFETPEEVDNFSAEVCLEQCMTKPDSVFTLPTGLTPLEMYNLWGKGIAQYGLDMGGMRSFNLDEYWPLPPNHPDSYHTYMLSVIQKLGIRPENWHIPRSDAQNPYEEAVLYDDLVTAAHVDLAVLGLGPLKTCHAGFNERGSTHDCRTRLVTLDPETVAINRALFSRPDDMPATALTQGIGTILEAKRILMIVKGAQKAPGVRRILEGPLGPDAPAAFMRLHQDFIIALDAAAASLLTPCYRMGLR